MASGVAAKLKMDSPVIKGLLVVLGISMVIAVLFAISSRKEASDPTLTAAPAIVATPGHPIVIHKKSPEAIAALMQQDGITPPASAAGQPATKQ